jgi:hypothetical protein
MLSNGAVAVGQQLGGSCLLLFYRLHVPTADNECAFCYKTFYLKNLLACLFIKQFFFTCVDLCNLDQVPKS